MQDGEKSLTDVSIDKEKFSSIGPNRPWVTTV